MTEQSTFNDSETVGPARALSVPVLGLVFALLLISVGSHTADPASTTYIRFPEGFGGEYLISGLRLIAILFGVSCLPGGLIGTVLGYLIAQNSKLASAALTLLRIGQWAPFVLWWALVQLLLMGSSEQPGRYFFVWTMSIPAVVLGTCYHFLCTRHLLGLEWLTVVTETARLAVLRAFYISLVLALSVWIGTWMVFPGNEYVDRHYVAASVLALFLILVNWIYRSDIQHTAELCKEFYSDFSGKNGASYLTAALVVLLMVAVWQLLSQIGSFRVSPVSVLNATVPLFSESDFWRDMRVSLLEIFAGVAFCGAIALIVSATLLSNGKLRRWILPVLSLTFVIPMVMLPAWHGWLLSWGTQSNTLPWQSICVACLSFYPVMQTVWALREEPLLFRIVLAVEHALPYGFAGILYGEMMSSTAGLGFTMVGATATHQTDKALGVFLITLLLLFGLSSVLRFAAKLLYSHDAGRNQLWSPTA